MLRTSEEMRVNFVIVQFDTGHAGCGRSVKHSVLLLRTMHTEHNNRLNHAVRRQKEYG